MRLPLLLSVPHAGWRVPPEAAPYAALSAHDIRRDGDEGAGEIYALADEVAAFATTDIARAIVDMNRAPDDTRKDGVVKTYTCWDVAVYDPPLPGSEAARLIQKYHGPYHERLRLLAARPDVIAGVDCHTMAATAPPEAPDPDQPRPRICISDRRGTTMPSAWSDALADALRGSFGCAPSRNEPFQGGYIIQEHSKQLPWVQLELSRAPWIPLEEKRQRILAALEAWVQAIQPMSHRAAAAGRRA